MIIAYIKNISQRYEIQVMCDNFYNKLKYIYNNTNTKNKFGKNGIFEISKQKGGLKKTRSLPFIKFKKISK